MRKQLKSGMTALMALSLTLTGGMVYAAENTAVETQVRPISAEVIAVPIMAPLQQPVKVTVLDRELETAGYIPAGAEEAMLPLREAAEALGYEIKWNEAERTAELTKGTVWTIVQPDVDRYAYNRMYKELGAAPQLNSDSKMYVPAVFFSDILRASVTTEGTTIRISEEERKSATTTGVVTSVHEGDNGKQTLRINGVGQDGLVLHLADDAEILGQDGKQAAFADIGIGQSVRVEHSLAVALSLPPQTAAFTVTLLDEQPEGKEIIGTSGQIEEVRSGDDGSTSIRIKGTAINDRSQEDVVLRLSEQTVIVDTQGEPVDADKLAQGAKVIGFHDTMLTKSLPPIGAGWKIVLLASADENEGE